MKPREPRVPVRVQARMRIGTEWVDVSIQNLSSRGLMAKTRVEVEQRSYVELRRGDQIVIGRIAWSRDGYFGLRSQDRIDITSMIAAPGSDGVRPTSASGSWVERRATPRDPSPHDPSRRAERSNAFARIFQFAVIGAAGASSCAAAAAAVFHLLRNAFLPTMSALGG